MSLRNRARQRFRIMRRRIDRRVDAATGAFEVRYTYLILYVYE